MGRVKLANRVRVDPAATFGIGGVNITAVSGAAGLAVAAPGITATATTDRPGIRKFNPGWYMESNQFNSPENAEKQANIQGEISRLFALPAWKGFYTPFHWAFLEPTKGNYDFSAIITMHNQLWAQGRRLGFAIAVQNFQWFGIPPTGAARPAWWANRTLPDWLVDEGYAAQMANGHCARLWDVTCRNYYRDLVIAASEALDGLPGIEFFEGPETSFQVVGDGTFSQTALHNSLIEFIETRDQYFPQTPCIWGLNYAGSQSQALSQALTAALNDWGCGGPDTNAGPPANTVPGAGQEVWGHMAWRGAGNDGTFDWGTLDLTAIGLTRCGVENNTIADMPDAGSAAQIESYMHNVMHAHYKVITKVESATWPTVGFDTGWVPAAAAVGHRVNTSRPANWPA